MENDNRDEIIDRALKALAVPELRDAKASRAIEELLVGTRKSGKLPSARLRDAVNDLVVETGAAKHLAGGRKKASGDSDPAEFSGLFALFFLLILLLLLASRIADDSDAAAELLDLIQKLLDLLRGGGAS